MAEPVDASACTSEDPSADERPEPKNLEEESQKPEDEEDAEPELMLGLQQPADAAGSVCHAELPLPPQQVVPYRGHRPITSTLYFFFVVLRPRPPKCVCVCLCIRSCDNVNAGRMCESVTFGECSRFLQSHRARHPLPRLLFTIVRARNFPLRLSVFHEGTEREKGREGEASADMYTCVEEG